MKKHIFSAIFIFSMMFTLAACESSNNYTLTEETPTSEIVFSGEISSIEPTINESAPPSEPLEKDNSFARAYLNILLEHETAIKEHWVTDAGQVAITDMDGDGIPELIYMKDNSEPWPGYYRSGLYIWTSQGNEAISVFSDDEIYAVVGGGMDYTILLLQNNELCVYKPSYNEQSVYSFKVYGFSEGVLEQNDAFQYSKGPSADYKSTVEEYRQNETPIDKDHYDNLVDQVINSGELVLATSFTSPEQYWNLPKTTMTFDEAIAYLQGLADNGTSDSETLTQSENAEPWRDAYASILRSDEVFHTMASNAKTVKFGLPDMDSDGIPELIIYDDYFLSCAIYVYSNGAATLLDTYGGGTSYWAWPHQDGILAQYKGEEEVFWTVSDGEMVQIPFSNSEKLAGFDINESNIVAHLLKITN